MRYAPLLITLAFLTSCAGLTPSSFIPGAKRAPPPPPNPKAMWMEGKYEDALALFKSDCENKVECDPYLKSLLALERFDVALPVARTSCEHSNRPPYGACSTYAELNIFFDPHSDPEQLLRPRCEGGDERACGTLGTYLVKTGHLEESEVPLRNACNKKDLASCHRLAGTLWKEHKETESVELFQSNCKNNWARSCRWSEIVVPHARKKQNIARKEKICRTAEDEGACHDAGVLLLISNKSEEKGLAYLKKACEEYGDQESCWELFLEKSELRPAETFKSELSSMCDEGIGNSCRNLAELEMRLGKKKESLELLNKGCQSEDNLSCKKLQELSKN